MTINTDGNGNSYIDANNVRVTWIRREDDGWTGPGDYIRLQAYRGNPEETQALHRGAELPVSSGWNICALVAAISALAVNQAAVSD